MVAVGKPKVKSQILAPSAPNNLGKVTQQNATIATDARDKVMAPVNSVRHGTQVVRNYGNGRGGANSYNAGAAGLNTARPEMDNVVQGAQKSVAASRPKGAPWLSREGTAAERRATYEAALKFFPGLVDGKDITFVDAYHHPFELYKDRNKFYEALKVRPTTSYGLTHKTTRHITIYRNAVVPYRGTIEGLYGGKKIHLNPIQNAIQTIGHENHHRNGHELESGTHIESNRAGYAACVRSGHC